MKKQLITILESIDPDNILTAEVREQLSESAEALINQKLDEKTLALETELKAKFEAEQGAACEAAEKSGYDKAKTELDEETDSKISEAEKNGFEAGVKEAISKAEVAASEYDESLKTAVLKLGEILETYVNLLVDSSVKTTKETVENRVVEAVDSWMTSQINEMYPSDLIINYERMVKLETIFESLKDILVIEDSNVQKAVSKVQESANDELKKAKLVLEQESQRRIVAERKAEEATAKALLCEKLEDLPVYERDILKKRFESCGTKEINESFDAEHAKIKRTLQVESTDAPDSANGIVTETVSTPVKEQTQKIVEETTTRHDIAQWASTVNRSCR